MQALGPAPPVARCLRHRLQRCLARGYITPLSRGNVSQSLLLYTSHFCRAHPVEAIEDHLPPSTPERAHIWQICIFLSLALLT